MLRFVTGNTRFVNLAARCDPQRPGRMTDHIVFAITLTGMNTGSWLYLGNHVSKHSLLRISKRQIPQTVSARGIKTKMKILHQTILISSLLTATASAQSQPIHTDDPLPERHEISRPPALQSPTVGTLSPASTLSSSSSSAASASPSTNANTASGWFQTISMTQNTPTKIPRPSWSAPPPKSSPSQSGSGSEEACSATGTGTGTESRSSTETETVAPSQTQTQDVRVPLGYVDATSLQWVFTWRKCGGGYESASGSVGSPSSSTASAVESLASSVVESSVSSVVGGNSTSVMDSATTSGAGPGWTTTTTETETKWVTVTETTTTSVPVVGLPTAKLP
ncbi:hypothetical protein B0T16DRAFT_400774 [Cercophora newfieldiana]|uniref:Uncharacterized protein n=1 Tax=Cercophora newfieldiana TaxID=92897 RepID=A0AA40D1F4_9PEZI|nr:hypothetical protein B0T16DRAFT_400774 [Cercophora newfieldiana]